MSDYAQLKVPDLKKILQDRGLVISGNKADLIARLQEHDKKTGLGGAGEDEIDWDEDDNKTTTAPPAETAAAEVEASVSKPTPATTQKVDTEPSKTTEVKPTAGEDASKAGEAVASSGATTTEPAPAPEAPKQDFTAGVQQTDAEKEAEKRAARAKRFGISEDDEAKKLTERAKKFGLENNEAVVKGLDSALPERTQRRGKRGREGRDDKHDGRSAKRQTPDRRTAPTSKPAAAAAKKPSGRIIDDPMRQVKWLRRERDMKFPGNRDQSPGRSPSRITPIQASLAQQGLLPQVHATCSSVFELHHGAAACHAQSRVYGAAELQCMSGRPASSTLLLPLGFSLLRGSPCAPCLCHAAIMTGSHALPFLLQVCFCKSATALEPLNERRRLQAEPPGTPDGDRPTTAMERNIMASYNSDFDPPTRPGESTRSRRLGTYIQPGLKMERREADIAHVSGQMGSRQRQPSLGRTQQTGLPKPTTRQPLPTSTAGPETRSRGTTTSNFGFGKPATQPRSESKGPALKGKSSRNVLRRKASSIAQQTGSSEPTIERSGSSTPGKVDQAPSGRRPSLETSLKSADAYNEIFTRPRARTPAAKESPRIIPELDRYRTRPEQSTNPKSRSNVEVPHKLATQDLPPPTPLLSSTPNYSGVSSTHRYSGYSGSGYSASPSTRFSESPGPGAYSRDTTPTSMSSQSPGIIAPSKMNLPRLRQASPATQFRPPITKRRTSSISKEIEEPVAEPQGLPSLRESVTSSSSNSTVKGDGKGSEKKKKKKRLSPLPPSPPPRKSSQKFKKSPEEQDSPSKPSQAPAKPVMTSPSESSPAKVRNVPGQSSNKSTPPMRPSREGAPDLQSQLGESMAVIQSNLAGFSFPTEKRRSTLPRNALGSPLQSQSVLRPPQGIRLPSRNPSPGPVLPSPREGTPAPAGLGIIPDLRPQPAVPSRGTATRTPSPSIQNTKPRFGLFRRAKTTPEVPTVEKAVRKGPVAGTGHEGYGRYAMRGRSSSAGTLGMTRERSQSRAGSSRDSTGSIHAHDPFLLERMSPVIIAGGGEIVENRNEGSELSRTESNTSIALGRPSMDSRGSSKSNLVQEVSRTTLWPSALPKEKAKRTSKLALPKGRRPSDSSDDGIIHSLAFRRSIQRLNSSAPALNLPMPLKIPTRGVSPAMSSMDTTILSDDSQLETKVMPRGRKPIQQTKLKKLEKPQTEKRAKSPRKWNFFHRSQPKKPEVEAPVQVAVGRPATAKTIPHYAMLDSSDEQQDLDVVDLEDILRDAHVIGLSNEELDALQFGNYKENLRRIENLHSMMHTPLPEPPAPVVEALAAPLFSSPEPILSTPEPVQTELHLTKDTAPVRPSRLPQVGRIPKVISARPQATSPKSFSRPFARLSIAQPFQEPLTIDKQSVAAGPSPPRPSTPEPIQQEIIRESVATDDASRQSSGDSKSNAEGANHRDFIVFSPRKNSEATTSSTGTVNFAGTTAVIPEVGDELAEDEVWDEYDDLIENDENEEPVSATSSHGVPFQYEGYESRRARKSRIKARQSAMAKPPPAITEPPPEPTAEPEPSRRSAFTTSSVYSADMSARLKEVVDTAHTPTTPMSFGDFIAGYGDRNNSANGDSTQRGPRSSRASKRSTSSNNSGARPMSEQESNSPISQVNLRVGSMTVSKWLTFGHVLFSPAREEIMQLEGSSKHHSILVIDGLGNDDWSFYAAETYPTSTFYNLSPTRPLSASQRSSNSTSMPLTPPNHRQVQYLSPMHKFPFPSSTFHVVVVRFPAAMPDSAYRNLISEAKRVLKPAGYLEMAILDLDMMNMGNRARRAVRGLKVKMQVADPSISLASASDTMLRLVGKRGFSDVKTCNVGVPVASTIPSSSSTNNSSDPNAKQKRQEMSLADMMKDESHVGDESITKMVAKVGRWWYTRCYEMGVMPDGDVSRSIFTDEHVLNECEKWNSSFKLVVAYAQKPEVGRRRTASV
ncbi:hypothetical protein G7Y89_g12619 [Cudoniella acicularis]|uniref:SAP domain-containing protein n=1 Tax=Cudoniella acicularis TaxID=354080 RepID=A0A8H4RAV8_9HELO|nr:hypothetical protein G7Y89_g12619 [Cudoniella acicularis]